MEYKTFLPVFKGFYNSIWEFNFKYIEEDLKEQRQELGLYSDFDVNDIDIDYQEYEENIARQVCDKIESELSNYVEKIIFENVYNPKRYNFSNDSINIKVIPKIENIKNFIYENKNEFCEYLKNNYTSCSGFISHYSRNFEDWQELTKDFSDYSENGHMLGSILQFICNIEDITEFNLYDYIEKNEFEYIKNYEEILYQSDNTLFEFLTKNGYSKEQADYFSVCYENKSLQYDVLDSKTISIIKEYENNLININN